MKHDIVFDDVAREELKRLTAFARAAISDRIEVQLLHEPERKSRNKKQLACESAGFAFNPPLWELRVGEYRVFYDVNGPEFKVTIRAIRRKSPDQTTEDVIR